MAKKLPYQLYVERNIKKLGEKTFITEAENAVRELAEFPSADIHQLIFFCNVLRYVKHHITNKPTTKTA
jgi:hypothetical protein